MNSNSSNNLQNDNIPMKWDDLPKDVQDRNTYCQACLRMNEKLEKDAYCFMNQVEMCNCVTIAFPDAGQHDDYNLTVPEFSIRSVSDINFMENESNIPSNLCDDQVFDSFTLKRDEVKQAEETRRRDEENAYFWREIENYQTRIKINIHPTLSIASDHLTIDEAFFSRRSDSFSIARTINSLETQMGHERVYNYFTHSRETIASYITWIGRSRLYGKRRNLHMKFKTGRPDGKSSSFYFNHDTMREAINDFLSSTSSTSILANVPRDQTVEGERRFLVTRNEFIDLIIITPFDLRLFLTMTNSPFSRLVEAQEWRQFHMRFREQLGHTNTNLGQSTAFLRNDAGNILQGTLREFFSRFLFLFYGRRLFNDWNQSL